MSRSSYARRPNQYLIDLREHWKLRRQGKRSSRATGLNNCWKPSNEASKADLREYHQEEMRLRRHRQRNRV